MSRGPDSCAPAGKAEGVIFMGEEMEEQGLEGELWCVFVSQALRTICNLNTAAFVSFSSSTAFYMSNENNIVMLVELLQFYVEVLWNKSAFLGYFICGVDNFDHLSTVVRLTIQDYIQNGCWLFLNVIYSAFCSISIFVCKQYGLDYSPLPPF